MPNDLTTRVRRFIGLASLLWVCASANAALIGVDRQTGTLVRINTANASTTVIRSVPDTVGLAFDSSTSRLYGLTPFALYDVLTGLAVGALSPPGLTGIAFGSAPNKLYTATESNLLTIDKDSAAVATVGPTGTYTGLVGYGAFTSDSQHRLIMGTNLGAVCGCPDDSPGDNLYVLDELTGAASLVFSKVTGEGGFDAIAVDAMDHLYGVTQQDSLLRLDLHTGQIETIGVVGYSSIRGLAFVPDDLFQGTVPEPGTLVLMLLAILLLGASRRPFKRSAEIDA